ncbi:MAG: response regulator [Vulcanimicrobiota bacterium]
MAQKNDVSGLNRNRVLIVDDNSVNVQWMRKMIEEWGYEVYASFKGVEGIKTAREKRPDLILLDVIMPDLTGYEVCRALKVHPATTDIPVIFLTAKGEVFDRIEGLDMGAHDYITKPFHPDELKIRMKTAILRMQEKERLKDETKRLKSQIFIDEVTGFYNFKYFQERINEEIARANRYDYAISLALISPTRIEEMKKLYSKVRIDSLMKQFGGIIKRSIRAIDIVARFNENTFAILLPQTNQEGAAVFGNKILKIIERHIFFGIPNMTKFSAQIGAATYEEFNVEEPGKIIREAEKALATSSDSESKVVVYEI